MKEYNEMTYKVYMILPLFKGVTLAMKSNPPQVLTKCMTISIDSHEGI
jgi:hypothetical protein